MGNCTDYMAGGARLYGGWGDCNVHEGRTELGKLSEGVRRIGEQQ